MGGASHAQASEPLANHPIFATRDAAEAEEHVGRLYAPHRQRVMGRQTFEGCMNAAPVGSMLLSYFSYRASVFIQCADLGRRFVINLPVGSSSALLHQEGRTLETHARTAGVVHPGRPLWTQWNPAPEPGGTARFRMVSLRIEQDALEGHLAKMLGAPLKASLRLEQTVDVGDRSRSYAETLRMVMSLLAQPDRVTDNHLITAQLEDALYTTLLLTHPHNHTAHLTEAWGQADEPARVRFVRDIIESTPQLPHTTATLAAEAGVSARTLQKAFRAHLSVPPSVYLQHVRLSRVHDELRYASDCPDATVTLVALRWGFAHLGRFSAAYRERYGVLPSETLRRAKGR